LLCAVIPAWGGLTRLRGFDPENPSLYRIRFDKYLEFHVYIGP
jgi:hypothetical protein